MYYFPIAGKRQQHHCIILLKRGSTCNIVNVLFSYCRQEAAAAAYKERLFSSTSGGCGSAAYPSPAGGISLSRRSLSGRTAAAGSSRGRRCSSSSRPRSRSSSCHSSSGNYSPAGAAAAGVDCSSSSPGRSRVKPVPNFAALHEEWESKLSHIKGSNRRRVTVPQVCVPRVCGCSRCIGMYNCIQLCTEYACSWHLFQTLINLTGLQNATVQYRKAALVVL
jgi:hypothetical protein